MVSKEEFKRQVRGYKDIFVKDIVWGQGIGLGIQYVCFLFDEENVVELLMVIFLKFELGEVVELYIYGCNYFEYIIEGLQMVGKVNFECGDVCWVFVGMGYGLIVVGFEGCIVLIVFQEVVKLNMILFGKVRKLVEVVV